MFLFQIFRKHMRYVNLCSNLTDCRERVFFKFMQNPSKKFSEYFSLQLLNLLRSVFSKLEWLSETLWKHVATILHAFEKLCILPVLFWLVLHLLPAFIASINHLK